MSMPILAVVKGRYRDVLHVVLALALLSFG